MDGWSKSSCGCVVVSRSRGGGTCRRCKWPVTTMSKKVPKCVATSHFFFFLFCLLVETAAKLRPSLALKFLESTSIRKKFYWPKSKYIAYHHCCYRRNQFFSVWVFGDDATLILSEMKVKCKNFYCLLFVITLENSDFLSNSSNHLSPSGPNSDVCVLKNGYNQNR